MHLSVPVSRLIWQFFGLSLIAGGLAMGVLYGQLLWGWQRAQVWVEVPCVLKKPEPPARPGQPPLAEVQEARYSYTYAGESYEGALVALALDPGSDLSADYEARLLPVLAAALRRGGEFRCFVNPAQPGQALLFREPRAAELLVLSLFVLIPSLFGAVLFFGHQIMRRKSLAVHALQSQHPGAPWLWRPEWAGGVIPPDNRPFPGYATGVAGWLCVVWGPMLWLLLTQAGGPAFWRSSQAPLNWLGLLPLIALLAALFLTLRSWWRYAGGWPQLQVRPLPVLTGGHLLAQIGLPVKARRARAGQPLQVRLACYLEHVEKDMEQGTRKRRELRWQAEQKVFQAEAGPGAADHSVTAGFDIPAGLPAEDQVPIGTAEFDRLKYLWELEVSAEKKRRWWWWSQGRWVYTLPVFSPHVPLRADSPEARAEALARKEAVAAENAAFESWTLQQVDAAKLRATLAAQHIGLEYAADGKTPARLHLRAARFSRGRSLPVFFVLLWLGATLALVRDTVPVIAPLLFGGVGLLLLGLLSLLYQTREVRLDAHGLDLRWRLGPWGRQQRLPVHEIRRFWVARGYLDLGSTRYRKVHAEMRDGRRVRVLDGVTDTRAAECLVTLLEHWRQTAG